MTLSEAYEELLPGVNCDGDFDGRIDDAHAHHFATCTPLVYSHSVAWLEATGFVMASCLLGMARGHAVSSLADAAAPR